jgi:hypothetical protein
MAITTADITRALSSATSSVRQASSYASRAHDAYLLTQALAARTIQYSSVWRGAWSSGATYQLNDLVEHIGSSYIAKSASTNLQPDTNPASWGLVAQKGTDGAGGLVNSTAGITGDGTIGTPIRLTPISTARVMGRATSGTGDVEYLTGSQVAGILPADSAASIASLRTLGASSVKAAPGHVVTTGRILYVKVGGDNTKSGANWAEAFETISYGITALTALGGGTLRIESGSIANDVIGAGIWVRGGYDVGAGGSGWVVNGNNITLEFVPHDNTFIGFGKAVVTPKGGSWIGPPLWVTGMQGGGFRLKNCLFDAGGSAWPAARLGVSSPLPVWNSGNTYARDEQITYSGVSYVSMANGNIGHQPDTDTLHTYWADMGRDDGLGVSLTAFLDFENVTFQKAGANSGTALDMGFTFWTWFNQCEFVHFSPAAPGGNVSTNSSIRYITSPSSALGEAANYLQHYTNCRISGGGIYSIGNTTLYISHMFGENMNYPGWDANVGINGGVADGHLHNFNQTDSSVITALFNKGTKVIRATSCGPTIGPVSVEWTDGVDAMSYNPGGVGLMGIEIFAEHDSARLLHGPSASVYPNVANNPSPFSSGTAAGPDGRADSAYVMNADYTIYSGNPAVGDVVCFGAWVNSPTPNSGFCYLANVGASDVTCTLGNRGSVTINAYPAGNFYTTWMPSKPWKANEWVWLAGWARIDSVVSGGVGLQVALRNGTGTISKPWVIHVPVGDSVPLSQVVRWVTHAAPTPAAWPGGVTTPAPSGTRALWSGDEFGMFDGSLAKWTRTKVDGGTWTGLRAIVGKRTGTDLTDTDATINPATDAASSYTLSVSLTNNRALTLGVTGSPITGAEVYILRRELTAHTYTVKDDAATTLFTFAASPSSPQGIKCRYNGTHYEFVSFFYLA